ncbi:hypothetical protein HanRHA438_Chr13g0595551 [Helianthus annuus]|nr:hypothetical protein HanRHA438_Chr13g0595551 [Helianthus annuus]
MPVTRIPMPVTRADPITRIEAGTCAYRHVTWPRHALNQSSIRNWRWLYTLRLSRLRIFNTWILTYANAKYYTLLKKFVCQNKTQPRNG